MGRASPGSEEEINAVLAACRMLVAISARSLAAVANSVDTLQFRALVVVATKGAVSLGELAEWAGMHLRLAAKGLLNRAQNPTNGRQVPSDPSLPISSKNTRRA